MTIIRVQADLRKKNLDAALFLTKDPHLRWLLGKEYEGILVVPARGKATLILSPLADIPKLDVRIVRTAEMRKELASVLKNKRRLGISGEHLTINQAHRLKKTLKGIKFISIDKELMLLRIKKTPSEIKQVKKACQLTAKLFCQLEKSLHRFSHEKEIVGAIKKFAEEHDCELAFSPLVASGKNAQNAHYRGSKKLAKGFLIIDAGLSYKGYCADMTRTYFLGTPTKKDEELYHKVHTLYDEAIAMLRPSLRVQKLAELLTKRFGNHCPHLMGHGVGLEVHEEPKIMEGKTTFVKNSIVAIEPGWYGSGKGVRIEDTILIGDTIQVLTKHPRTLLTLKTKNI